MPYGSNPWMDLTSGTSGINQSMANVALAQRQAQYMAQQNAAKMALEQARLQIERDAEARAGRVSEAQIPMYNAETERYKAETKKYGTENELAQQTMATQQRLGRLKGYGGAPDIMSMVQDPFSGPRMMGDLRAASVVPQGQFQLTPQQLMQALQAALGSQTYQQAMGTASAAQRAGEPYQVGPNNQLVDPFSMKPTYTAPPAPVSPYQRGELDIRQAGETERERHNLILEELRQREVAARGVEGLGRAFETGDLMDEARRQMALSMGMDPDRAAAVVQAGRKKPPPEIGTIKEDNGVKYKFTGGDPADPKNWKKQGIFGF